MTKILNLSARLLGLSLSLGIASGVAGEIPRDTRYLALGDSISFGFNPLVPLGDLNQYTGFPEILSRIIHRKVANASCFGESSGSFLVLNAPDLGCQAWRANFPLHVAYSGTQMQYTLDYLKANLKKTDLITIDLGGNDLGLLLLSCNFDVSCARNGLGAALAAYAQNLMAVFGAIRGTGYTGPIIAFTPYAVNYNDPVEVGGLMLLNGTLAQVAPAFNVTVADIFGAFLAADIPFGNNSCAAGLLIQLPNGTCDTHPTLAGQTLIAQTIAALIAK